MKKLFTVFNPKELNLLRALSSPTRIQNFLNDLQYNTSHIDTCYSPRTVLKKSRAHCIEGSLLAATALRMHGFPPLIIDLTASNNDLDHVIAIFQKNGFWGAISKTNHAVLRFREPVYKNIRELVMSFFHEYTNDDGKKTLRSYSEPVDLSQFDNKNWMTSHDHLWYIAEHLIKIPHTPILSRSQIATLRYADPIEIKIGNIKEWPKNKNSNQI